VSKVQTKKRPDELQGKTIKQATEEGRALVKRNVHKVSVHSAGEGAATGTTGQSFTPDSEQLAKINQFTRREVTADDVIAFGLDAMNDLYDRDDEKFTTDTVKEFADLPQPFSFVGKSYMVDHEYKMANARGRIFDVGTETQETPLGEATFLKPTVYTPKTPQYENFIEGLEFGINWACSVGVVVDRSLCSICSSPIHGFGSWAWCSAGHEKGYFYVPGKEEEDGWGYFIPVDPSTKGAVKAMVDLHGAVDGYEISSVFLGAQYMAQLGEKSAVRKIFAAAERAKLPILGLSAKEAASIKMPHEPEAVQEARAKFSVVTENGVVKWTDEAGLVWAWDSNGTTNDILCLGKKKDAADEDDDDQSAKDADEDDSEEDDDASEDDDDDESEDDDDDSDDEDDDSEEEDDDDTTAAAEGDEITQAQAALDAAQQRLAEAQANVAAADKSKKKTTKEASITAKNVLSAALAAKLPKEITDQLATAPGTGLETVLSACSKTIKSQAKDIRTLTPRAELGDKYIKEVTADAVHWFTVSRRDPKNPEKGVNVDFAKQMIDRCEGDVELIKALAKDWKGEAQAKFPQSSRRSAVSDDPNERTKAMPDVPFGPESEDRQTEKVVSRLHRTGRE
jgi:hypothetical protein